MNHETINANELAAIKAVPRTWAVATPTYRILTEDQPTAYADDFDADEQDAETVYVYAVCGALLGHLVVSNPVTVGTWHKVRHNFLDRVPPHDTARWIVDALKSGRYPM